MSVTIASDVKYITKQILEPCLCAQFANCWTNVFANHSATTDERAELKTEANSTCHICHGTGLEYAREEINSKSMNLTNDNAKILFDVLGVNINGENGFIGEISLPDARRAIMRAKAKDLSKFVRAPEKIFGKPREMEPGVINMKPLRYIEHGLDKEEIETYLHKFTNLVLEAIEKNGTKVIWY